MSGITRLPSGLPERPFAKPAFRRSPSLSYDRSQLCPRMRNLDFSDDPSRGESLLMDGSHLPPESVLGSQSSGEKSVASKSFHSALGTASFKRTTAELAEYHEYFGGASQSTLIAEIASDSLQRLVDSICVALEDDDQSGYGNVGTYRHHCRDITFEPRGCMWTATVVPTSVEGDDNEGEQEILAAAQASSTSEFRVRILCNAIDAGAKGGKEGGDIIGGPGGDGVSYVVDIHLLSDDAVGPAQLSDPDRVALTKKFFDEVVLDVKKAVVRCEMPEFPEGLKGNIFRDIYQLNVRLKSGSFATVCRGTHRATGKKVAIKCVLRRDMPPSDDAAIYDEVSILASLKHRYICPLVDFFEEKEGYFIVMELMSGGDLFDRIGEKKSYDEADARGLCKKLLDAVSYCHDNNIAHCDMKPKNLLLRDEEDDAFIKLADFGFATRVYGPKSLTKQCGTPFFVAPEILLKKKYDTQVDMWSVGILVYLLLSGDLPFVGRNQRQLFKAIVSGQFEFQEENWSDVSEDAKEMIRGLLVTDPDKRMTAKQVMACKWMRSRGDLLRQHRLAGSQQRLQTFNARMKIRSAMISVQFLTGSTVWKSTASGLGNNEGGGRGSMTSMARAARSLKETIDEGNDETE